MNKSEFTRKIKELLFLVPIDERKKWETKDLMIWWMNTKKEDSYVKINNYTGDHWQEVNSVCMEFIGKKAIN